MNVNFATSILTETSSPPPTVDSIPTYLYDGPYSIEKLSLLLTTVSLINFFINLAGLFFNNGFIISLSSSIQF